MLRKRRSFQQIMEEQSLDIIRKVLPEEWVIHEYKPDYGIDFIVEVFKYLDGKKEVAETLGELFFVQAKSIMISKVASVRVYPRANVEKTTVLEETREEYIEIEAIRFELEVSELATIQAMGAAVPVLLFLVVLDIAKVYFVCLNDIIDKVIIPSDPGYDQRGKKTVLVPLKNEINPTEDCLIPLRFLARRSKLYAAFAKFQYQFHEVLRYDQRLALSPDNFDFISFRGMIQKFIKTAQQLDIWHTVEWSPVQWSFAEIAAVSENLSHWTDSEEAFDLVSLMVQVVECWRKLDNLSRMFEELCREWFLPTFLAQLASYPDQPTIIKAQASGRRRSKVVAA